MSVVNCKSLLNATFQIGKTSSYVWSSIGWQVDTIFAIARIPAHLLTLQREQGAQMELDDIESDLPDLRGPEYWPGSMNRPQARKRS
jgi:hypothetical protein